MEKKKERSCRQRLKVDTSQEGGEDGTLLLANPMAGGEVSPHALVSQDHHHHHQPKAASTAPSKKSKPKSPSLLRFFVRGTRKSGEEEDAVDLACSDHEDAFSQAQRYRLDNTCIPDSPVRCRFDRNIEVYATMPRRRRRVEKRDSGFLSERSDSTSQDKDHLSASPEEDIRLMGLEALETLHNQIQILVKQDAPEEDIQLNTIHDAVIASLRQQLEDVQQSLDFLHQSDHNLRLSLKDAEQRAMEAETKLLKSNERNQRLEHKLAVVTQKYQQLKLQVQCPTRASLSLSLTGTPASPTTTVASPTRTGGFYSPQVQRIQRDLSSQSLFSEGSSKKRPNSALSMRQDSMETRV